MPTTFWFHVNNVRYGLWHECVVGDRINNRNSITNVIRSNSLLSTEKAEPKLNCDLNNQGKKRKKKRI
jgi:hypothetical protein